MVSFVVATWRGVARSQAASNDDAGGGCSTLTSKQYLNNVDCGNLNVGPRLSVSVARSQCKRTKGCTWTE